MKYLRKQEKKSIDVSPQDNSNEKNGQPETKRNNKE